MISFPSNYQVSEVDYCKISSTPVRNTKTCVILLVSFAIKSVTLPPLTRVRLEVKAATLRRQTAPPSSFDIFVPANETLFCSTQNQAAEQTCMISQHTSLKIPSCESSTWKKTCYMPELPQSRRNAINTGLQILTPWLSQQFGSIYS